MTLAPAAGGHRGESYERDQAGSRTEGRCGWCRLGQLTRLQWSGSPQGQLVGLVSKVTSQDLYTDMRMISAHASAAAGAVCVGSSRHSMYLSIAPVKK